MSRTTVTKNSLLAFAVSGAVALVVTSFCLQGGTARAAETAAPPAMPAMPAISAAPAGQYQLDKSHASLVLRVSHLGFSTYTTRFSRYDAALAFDPKFIGPALAAAAAESR